MKPILLELSNFGPYVGAPVRIEFDQLERLFLIAGDTGSGKTTLFDAMCYALYGAPLGTREEKSLRSHLADEKESTVVTFVFEMDVLFDYLDLVINRGVPVLAVLQMFGLSLGFIVPLSVPCATLR